MPWLKKIRNEDLVVTAGPMMGDRRILAAALACRRRCLLADVPKTSVDLGGDEVFLVTDDINLQVGSAGWDSGRWFERLQRVVRILSGTEAKMNAIQII